MTISTDDIRRHWREEPLFFKLFCTLSAMVLVAASSVLLNGRPYALPAIPLSVPFLSISLGIDRLSAFFLIPTAILSAAAALYSKDYLHSKDLKKDLMTYWTPFVVLCISMCAVFTARNGLFFLMAWEVMALSSFFLVMFDDRDPHVRDAGWLYLIASHIGTACLIALFAVMAHAAGSLEFNDLKALSGHGALQAGVCFSLALIGFGVKAGFIALHVWLPEAHPAAPSPVSALMSGIMIKTGLYGVLRTISFLGEPPAWFGITLALIGAATGLFGVFVSLAQHDIKRVLAYSSVENVGVISIGIGLGLLGVTYHMPAVSLFAFAGAMLHILNHALFKGLLFLNVGAVVHAYHTRELDRLGGVAKKMPSTAILFALGSAAICGLPPLNGFVSEFLIYLAAAKGLTLGNEDLAVSSICAIAALAVIGGLSIACFSRVFGVVFLGEPRSVVPAGVRDPDTGMLAPMIFLAGLCVLFGLLTPLGYSLAGPVAAELSGIPGGAPEILAEATRLSFRISGIFFLFLFVTACLVVLRRRLSRGVKAGSTVTWDCGYAAPAARMQYTASSFAQPITSMLSGVLCTSENYKRPRGVFPGDSFYVSIPVDIFKDRVFTPVLSFLRWLCTALRWLQHGHLHIYVLYIALTALILVLTLL